MVARPALTRIVGAPPAPRKSRSPEGPRLEGGVLLAGYVPEDGLILWGPVQYELEMLPA